MAAQGWILSVEGVSHVLRPVPELLAELAQYGVQRVRFFAQQPTAINTFYFQGQFDLGVGPRTYNLLLEEHRGGRGISSAVWCVEGARTQPTTPAEDRAGLMLAQVLVATLQPGAFALVKSEQWPGSPEKLKEFWALVADWEHLPKLGQPLTWEEEQRIAVLSPAEAKREIAYLCWQGEQAGLVPEHVDQLRELLKLMYAEPDRYQRFIGTNDVGHTIRPLPYTGE